MKKKIFNPKLYLEGLDQLKLMGFILTLFTMLVTAIPPVAQIIDNLQYEKYTIGYSKQSVDMVFGIAPAVLVFMYLGSYIFSSFIFSFGNKRKASDFYDSLQNTRLCTYVSFGLAALTWITFIILANNIEGIVLYNIAGDIAFTPWEFIRSIIYELLVAYGVAGATFAAMALTGTAFSNFMVMAIILLLPRFCITFYQVVILEEARTIAASSLMGFFDPAHNLITGLVTSLMGYNLEYLLSNTWGYFYTLILDCAYFALAGLFFHIRKTETAEKSAPNRLMQHVIRCGLSLPFGLFFGWGVYYVLSEGFWDEAIIPLLLFALVAFIYFVYEAITTKSFKRLGKSVPLFIVLVAVSVGTMFGAVIAANVMDRRVPDADKITAVTVAQQDYNYDSGGNYIDLAESRIKYTDKTFIEKIVRDLDYSYTYYHDGGIFSFGDNPATVTEEVRTYDGPTTEFNTNPNSSYNPLDFSDWGNYVRFYYKSGRTEIRRVDFSYDTVEYFDELRANTPEYINAIYQLPDTNVVNCYIEALDSPESKEIYSIYREEAKELPYTVLKTLVNSYNGIDISVTVKDGGSYNYSNFTITQETPKALAKYIELTAGAESSKNFFRSIVPAENKEINYCEIYLYNATSGTNISYYLAENPEEPKAENYDKINELIEKAAGRDPADRKYTMYTMNGYTELLVDGEYMGENCHAVVLLMTQEEMNTLTELLDGVGITRNSVDKY